MNERLADRLAELGREIDAAEAAPFKFANPLRIIAFLRKLWGLLKAIVEHIEGNPNGKG